VLNLTEEMVSGLVMQLTGGYTTKLTTQGDEVLEINWARPWRRVEMIPALEEALDVTFPPGDQLHTAETGEFLKKCLAKGNIKCAPPLTNARMLDKLVGEYIEETCVNPTFIIGHPQMSEFLVGGGSC
jgi:lysyl-tRNA synthetase, class II